MYYVGYVLHVNFCRPVKFFSSNHSSIVNKKPRLLVESIGLARPRRLAFIILSSATQSKNKFCIRYGVL